MSLHDQPDREPMARPDGHPAFAEPWEAQIFAMVLAAQKRGLFSWSEWNTAIQGVRAEQTQPRDTDYRLWADALEQLLARKGLVTLEEQRRYRQAWAHAAHRTPHGQPIELTERDFDPPQPPQA